MAKTRGRAATTKPDRATVALIRKEVRKANQPTRTVRRAPLSRTVAARPLSGVTKADMERRARIRSQQHARRMPFVLWVWTVVVAAAVWGVSSAVAAIYGPWPRTWVALSFGVVVLAATGITRAVKAPGPDWAGRVWLAGIAAAATVTTAGLQGPSWQLLGFTVAATWILSAAWWQAHRIEGAAPPPIAEPADLLARYTDLWYRNVACPGGPLPGATLTDGHHTDHGTIAFLVQARPGTGGLTEANTRLSRIATGLRESLATVLLDDLERGDDERHDASQFRLQIVLRSTVVKPVPWTEPVYDGGALGIGPYADGDGYAYVGLHTANSLWPTTVIGSIGSGKTALVDSLVTEARAAMPTVVAYIDGKGGSSSPWLAEHASIVITDEAEFFPFAKAMLRAVLYRQALLASQRKSGFTPSVELPVFLVVIDECHLVFSDKRIAQIWVRISTTSRSGGVATVAASQHAGLRIFGGYDELRSSMLAGTIIGMRCTSRSTRGMLHPDLEDLRRLPTGGGWGYAIGQQVTRPGIRWRAAHLPSPDDQPDGMNSAVALARYPDAACDAGTRAAIGGEWFDGAARRARREAELTARLEYFMGGWRDDEDDDDGGRYAAPAGSDLDLPPVPQPASHAAPEPVALSGRLAEVVAFVEQRPDGVRMADVATAVFGGDQQTAGTYLGRLVPKYLQRLERGRYVRAQLNRLNNSTTQQSEC